MCNWNFHAYIACPLEIYARKYIHKSYITADEIEQNSFFETMYSILNFAGVDKEDVTQFIDMCRDFEKCKPSDMPRQNVEEIFSEFKRLIGE